MSKKLSKDEFLTRATSIHGNKYDYSEIEYVDARTPIKILCHKKWITGEEHGAFWQTPEKHLCGQGCKKCQGRGKTTEIIVAEFRQIHGNKYDYSKVIYKGNKVPITIICHEVDETGIEHGEFQKTPADHLRGQGCQKCTKRHMDTDYFIKKAQIIHKDKYDYSKSVYVNDKTLINIICPIHGNVPQTAYSHLHSCGCNKCANRYMDKDYFVEKSCKIHGNKYDYSKVEYKKNNKPVIITCPIHGDFNQTPADHLNGCGCPECGKKSRLNKRRLPLEDFLVRASKKHNNKYDYSLVRFENEKDIIDIICPTHGIFSQEVYSHLSGCGCPSCSHSKSKSEYEIKQHLENDLNIKLECRNRKFIKPYEIDLIDAQSMVGLEFHGLIWHSERFKKDNQYHLKKANLANQNGVHLLQIFEDEYINKPNLVLQRIKTIISRNNEIEYDNIKEVTRTVAEIYLKENSIEDLYESTIYLGSFHKEQLNGIISFRKRKDCWYIGNMVFDNYIESSKLINEMLKTFIQLKSPSQIIVLLDKRWYNKFNVLTDIGFKLIEETRPINKFYSNKHPNKRYTKTEIQQFNKCNWYKIWDAGRLKYQFNIF